MKKIVCEISGGYDSAYSAILAKKKYGDYEFHGVIVNYGQLTYNREFEISKKFCENEKIKLHEINIKNLFFSGTVLGEKNNNGNDIYTPLRNLVILGCVASYTETISGEVIIVGSKGLNVDDNPYSFKDSVLPFYTLFQSTLNYLTDNKIKIDPILMNNRNNKMTKKEVYDGLLENGYDINYFWNCFNSSTTPCGVCNNCKEKIKLGYLK